MVPLSLPKDLQPVQILSVVDVIKGQNKLDVDGCVFVCVSVFCFSLFRGRCVLLLE